MKIRLSPVLICVLVAIIVIALLFGSTFYYAFLPKPEWTWLAFLRLAGAFLLIGTSLRLFVLGCRSFAARASTNWWDPAASPDGKLSWDHVRALTLDESHDPLAMERTPRWGQIVREMIAAVLVIGALASLAIAAAKLLGTPADIPGFSDGKTVTGSAGLTVFLALLTATLTIVFTFYQLKAKVRADNRQVWIARLRTTIAEVVALSTERASLSGRYEDRKRSTEIWRELSPKRLELELLLNPSEKDHRLLMHFSQLLTLDDVDHIEDAQNLRASIARELGCDRANIPEPWNDLLVNAEPPILVGRTMRLSHVVLKREWERVKSAR